jgi:hypothetical protein
MKAAAIRLIELTVAALWLATTPTYAAPVIVLIISCYDGDTCKADREFLPDRNRVSLANVDTPEIDGKCRDEVHRAVKARDETAPLICSRVTRQAQFSAKFRCFFPFGPVFAKFGVCRRVIKALQQLISHGATLLRTAPLGLAGHRCTGRSSSIKSLMSARR